MSRYVFRLGRVATELPVGISYLGRSPECRVRLEEGLVSRRHARVEVGADGVYLEDLGSVNGTLVNGELLLGRRRLAAGDIVQIGSCEVVLDVIEGPRRNVNSPLAGARSLSPPEGAPTVDPEPVPPRISEDEPTLVGGPVPSRSVRTSAGVFLAELVEKAFSLGKLDDARRLIAVMAENVSRDQIGIESALSRDFVELSLKLAERTGEWVAVDRVFEVGARLGWRLPAAVIEAIANLTTLVRHFRGPGFMSYLDRWRSVAAADPTMERDLSRLLLVMARRTLAGNEP